MSDVPQIPDSNADEPEDTSKVLKWGETVFDDLSHEELKLHALRLLSATESLSGIAQQFRYMMREGEDPYWKYGGTGGQALERGRQAMAKARDGFNTESEYYSFFRYANDLLFEEVPAHRMHTGWVICHMCGDMIGNIALDGKSCEEFGLSKKCSGTFRKLTWADMKKLADKAAEPVDD